MKLGMFLIRMVAATEEAVPALNFVHATLPAGLKAAVEEFRNNPDWLRFQAVMSLLFSPMAVEVWEGFFGQKIFRAFPRPLTAAR